MSAEVTLVSLLLASMGCRQHACLPLCLPVMMAAGPLLSTVLHLLGDHAVCADDLWLQTMLTSEAASAVLCVKTCTS